MVLDMRFLNNIRFLSTESKHMKVRLELLRFLLVGFSNTLLTYLIYLIALFFFHYYIAYSISFLSGVFIAYYFNSSVVFKSSQSTKKALKFFFIYILQYFIGIFLLRAFIKLGLAQTMAPWCIVCIMTPLNFVLMKRVLSERYVTE